MAYDFDFLDDCLDAGRYSTRAADREQVAGDASPHEPRRPDAVAWPASTAEVSRVLAAANDRGIPVTPRSGGSSLEGNAIPVAGGLVLSTADLTSVDVRPDDLSATVGAGVVYDDLNDRLARHGLRFPPGISSSDVATVGGMVANNASGFNAVRYGETRDHVRALEVVLADGRVVECGSDVVKSSSGYSLKDLFVGSEGTLGIVTEVTLALSGIPAEKRAAIVSFPDVGAAARTVADVVGAGLQPGAIEFLDAFTVEQLRAYADVALPESPTLILELHANNAGVDEDLAFARGICEEHGAERWEDASDGEMDEIWQARRDALPAARAYDAEKDVVVIGDVVVPISKYPDIVTAVADAAADLGVPTPSVGHAGDGNLHYTPLADFDDPDAMERAHELNERVVETAIDLGGTSTGEHGVGTGKRKFMAREHGPAGIDLMRSVKETFDPKGILNPGKVLPDD
ncbi:FAD-binding oxidoreductase [Halocalculus aciditolerans]|uniref:D-lactate dehydrogenase (cytochrome) n=1 Tax=Halocalculus aciditolerans TaxID=1383812 RepID=A0A830FJK4_9EURY|nr:FAD-binding oxidoreductase [Halocalculus aciditolerans]GGL58938.1 FAD-binding protein [Halocalculus aciditolerans]